MENEQKIKLLLVEDDAMLSEMYVKKFVLENFEVLAARDGEEGLETALREKPDIVLLDLLMPKKDGMTMLKELRQDPWGKTVPTIILTNLNANDKIIQEITENQPAYYLMKTNAVPSEVVDKIKEVLKVQ